MKGNLKFEARVFQNKTTKQYSFIPSKKNMSKEVIALMEDPNVKGFRLEIVKELTEMPKPNLILGDKKKIGTKRYYNNMYKRQLILKGGRE